MKQKQWREFVDREGPMHWAHPDNVGQNTLMLKRECSRSSFTSHVMVPAFSCSTPLIDLEGVVIDQVELDFVFEKYIQVL